MNAFVVFAWAKLRMASHGAAGVRRESKLKVGVVALAALLLWAGAFGAFFEGFQWLEGFDRDAGPGLPTVGEIVMLRILSVFSLALFLMLIFSNVLVSFATFYRAQEMRCLVQAPLTWRELFAVRFGECVVFSSWASAFLGSPMILGYGLVTGAHPAFYMAAILYYLPFVIIPASLGTIVTILLVRIWPRLTRSVLIAAAAVAALLLAVYIRHVFVAAQSAEDALFGGTDFASFGVVSGHTQSPWWPSSWAAEGLIEASRGNLRAAVFRGLLLLANAALAVWLASEACAAWFYAGWNQLIVGGRRRGTNNRLGFVEKRLRGLPQPARSLVIKDIKLFWRDPAQWLQFAVFFGILGIYAALIRGHASIDVPHYRSWVVSMNIGACTLILATLTSRFVFPLVSLEGQRIWILGLAPLTMGQVVKQKYWTSTLTTGVFPLAVVLVSCWRLEVEPVGFAVAVYSIIVTTFGLNGLAVGLGSLYPNFQEDNPARVVSGMGGTLNLLASMGYIALIVAAETVIIQWRALEEFASPGMFYWALAGVLVFVTGLSIAAAVIPLRLGLRNLEAAEF